MQEILFNKLLMALSILTASPENNIQINSQNVDVSSLVRSDFTQNAPTICKLQEMKNLSSTIEAAVDNQLNIQYRINQVLLDLQSIGKLSSTSELIGCDKQQVGKVNIKLPNLPNSFPVWCTTNKYGDNWLLIAHRDDSGKLFLSNPTHLAEKSIGGFEGEYFIGFQKLRAITDSYLCELLIVRKTGKEKYDHYEFFAIGADNKVKLLGPHRTNKIRKSFSFSEHMLMVNEKIALKPAQDITIYLRRVTLNTIAPLKVTI